METKSFDELKGNPKNPRYISDHDGKALSKSMTEFGDLSGIVFNTQTQQLVGGHQRIEILKRLPGKKTVVIEHRYDTPDQDGTVAVGYVFLNNKQYAYREVSWPYERELAANIAANRIQGQFDLDLLAEANYLLHETSPDLLALTGQTELEINKSLADVSGEGFDPNGEWDGMPEFGQDDQMAVKRLVVNFKDMQDVVKFAEIIGQQITDKTRYVWFPEVEKAQVADKQYE